MAIQLQPEPMARGLVLQGGWLWSVYRRLAHHGVAIGPSVLRVQPCPEHSTQKWSHISLSLGVPPRMQWHCQ